MSEFSNENAEERKRANKMMQQMQRKWRKQAFQVHYLEGHNDLITAVDVCQDMLLSGRYMYNIRAQLLKGLIAYPVDNFNSINMVFQLFIDYESNIFAFLRPFTLLNYK